MSDGDGGGGGGASRRMPDAASPPLNQSEAGAASGAADGEKFPLVTRIFPDKKDAKREQRMHALLSADLYFKPYTGQPGDAPKSFVDFRGARDCVRLERLPPGSTIDKVCSAVAGKHMPATYGDCALVISGSVREKDGRSEGKAGPADVVLVLESVEVAQEWLEGLRMRVMPWDLIGERVKATFTQSAAVNEVPSILQAMKEVVNEDHEREKKRKEESAEEEAPRATVSRTQTTLRQLVHAAKFSLVTNLVAPSTAAFVKASEVGDTVTRVLGGVALVGPVLSVAALALHCAELAAQAQDDRLSLGRLLVTDLPQTSRRLALSVYHILSCSVRIDSIDTIVDNVYKASEKCWSLLLQTERQLLDERRNQIRHTYLSTNILDAMKELKLQLQFAQQAELSARWQTESWTGLEAMDGRVKELENGVRKREDKLEESVYVGPPAPKVVSRSALPPQFEQLLSAVLDGGTVSVSDGPARMGDNCVDDPVSSGNAGSSATTPGPILAVEGQGGVGKTTTLLLVAADDRVRKQFDYRLVLELGQEATEETVIAALADLVQASGGLDVAEQIRDIPRGGVNRLRLAVTLARTWLQSKFVLLVLDNVWTRAFEVSESTQPWVEELAPIASKPGSAVLVSTRHEGVADSADEAKRFKIGLLRDRAAAMSLFESHAILEPGDALPNPRPEIPVPGGELKQYKPVVEEVLKVCDGWPLALAMCGAMVRANGYQWGTVGRFLRASVVKVKSAWTYVKHPGLQAVFLSNLSLACNLESDNALFLALPPDVRSKFLERVDFEEKFQTLAVLDGTRAIPVYVLGVLFNVSDEEAVVIARVFASTGLATLRSESISGDGGMAESQYYVIVLHDLQHAFAESLTRYKHGIPVSRLHSNLLREGGKRFCEAGDPPTLNYDWSLLCEHRESGSGNGNLATYLCSNLMRHLIAADSEAAESKAGFSGVVALLCSYGWIRARGTAFGRRFLLDDFATAIAFYSGREGSKEEPILDAQSRRGVLAALKTLAEVLQRIDSHQFDPVSPCETHGERDSGLAGELYGRVAVLKFELLKGYVQRAARQVVFELQASIRESARPPWLRPRGECYESVECKDSRCVLGFPAWENRVFALAYVRSGDEKLLLSGGVDNGVRVFDVRTGGREVEVWSSKSWARTIAVAEQGYAESPNAAVVAVCGLVSVGLWEMRPSGEDRGKYLHNLPCVKVGKTPPIHCLTITPDAQRVAAGVECPYDDSTSGDEDSDESAGGYEHCVYVWTRRTAATDSSASSTRGEYAGLALTAGGHTACVTAVQMYQNGEHIVSGSWDGAVRVWRVPMDALLTAADVHAPRVLDLRAAAPCRMGDFVKCLQIRGNSASAFAGMHSGTIHMIDCGSMLVEASLRTLATGGARVQCMALVGACGSSAGSARERLFAGHWSGLISEWDVGSLSCSTVYGDARSGVGNIISIAAGVVQSDDHQSGRGRKPTSEVAGGSYAGSVGNEDMGVSEGAVEFATGNDDGYVHVWRAGPPSDADSGESAPSSSVSDCGVVTCIVASANGQRLASGSRRGLVSVWDVDFCKVLVSLRGHSNPICGVDISSNGHVIASCSEDAENASVWTSQDGGWSARTARTSLSHDTGVSCIALTADASLAISGDSRGQVRVWATGSGTLLWWSRDHNSATITSLAFGLESGHEVELVPGGVVSSSSSSRMSTEWTDNVSECGRRRGRRSLANSAFSDCHFASRDKAGHCALWSLESDEAVKSADGVPSDVLLRTTFSDVIDSVDGKSWSERKHCYWDRPRTFTLDERDGELKGGCIFRSNRGDLTVLPSTSVSAASCSCAAKVYPGGSFLEHTLYAFNRREGGRWQTVVCCRLGDGTLAIFDLVHARSCRKSN